MMIPNYLQDYAAQYNIDPRQANKDWFRDAKYGLFLHFGLYSLLGRHEWVQLRERIPVAEYAKLKDHFTIEHFDANNIADFAVACGMKYINLTTRHHDSFCLWDATDTDFNSVNSPCKRDPVCELAQACRERGLGFFLYYSHGRDWKHPDAPNNDRWGGSARPAYNPSEPSYHYGADHDLQRYVTFMRRQIQELIHLVPDAAGIWLDGIAVPASGDKELFQIQSLYDMIRELSPHMLVSYKQGLYGSEDFFAPEHAIPDTMDDDHDSEEERLQKARMRGQIGSMPDKQLEICTTMIKDPISWGYMENAVHMNADELWNDLHKTLRTGANILLNTGLRGDGSIDPLDRETMLQVGQRIRQEGLPLK